MLTFWELSFREIQWRNLHPLSKVWKFNWTLRIVPDPFSVYTVRHPKENVWPNEIIYAILVSVTLTTLTLWTVGTIYSNQLYAECYSSGSSQKTWLRHVKGHLTLLQVVRVKRMLIAKLSWGSSVTRLLLMPGQRVGNSPTTYSCSSLVPSHPRAWSHDHAKAFGNHAKAEDLHVIKCVGGWGWDYPCSTHTHDHLHIDINIWGEP